MTCGASEETGEQGQSQNRQVGATAGHVAPSRNSFGALKEGGGGSLTAQSLAPPAKHIEVDKRKNVTPQLKEKVGRFTQPGGSVGVGVEQGFKYGDSALAGNVPILSDEESVRRISQREGGERHHGTVVNPAISNIDQQHVTERAASAYL